MAPDTSLVIQLIHDTTDGEAVVLVRIICVCFGILVGKGILERLIYLVLYILGGAPKFCDGILVIVFIGGV
jgi:hypothetical protein